jgi:hypothetical protein
VSLISGSSGFSRECGIVESDNQFKVSHGVYSHADSLCYLN